MTDCRAFGHTVDRHTGRRDRTAGQGGAGGAVIGFSLITHGHGQVGLCDDQISIGDADAVVAGVIACDSESRCVGARIFATAVTADDDRITRDEAIAGGSGLILG